MHGAGPPFGRAQHSGTGRVRRVVYVLDMVLCARGDAMTSEARSEKATQLPLCCWGPGLAGLRSPRDHHAGAQLSPPFPASAAGHWTGEK